MFSISSSSVEEGLEPRPRHVGHVAAGDDDVAHRRACGAGSRASSPCRSTGLPANLSLSITGRGVADQVHPGAVPAVLRAGRQQLGEHLGGVAVGQPLGDPHVVLVQRVAGGVRVRWASRCDGRRTPAACSGGPGRRRRPRSASRGPAAAPRAAPSCSSSAAAPASTSWRARPGRARGRRRSARRRGRPSASRSCLRFLTQCARCHCALAHSAAVTSRPAGEPGPVGLDELDPPVGVGLAGLAARG